MGRVQRPSGVFKMREGSASDFSGERKNYFIKVENVLQERISVTDLNHYKIAINPKSKQNNHRISFIKQLRNSKNCVRAQSDLMLKKVLPFSVRTMRALLSSQLR